MVIQKKISVIPNGYAIDKFKFPNLNELKEKYINPDKMNMIHIGREDKRKNQIGFIKVAQKISTIHQSCNFSLVGSGVDNSCKN